MQKKSDRCPEAHRNEALEELRAELADFSHDGLIELMHDLASGIVMRGSWSGCVISYKRGAAGSARRDRLGRARNAFTILWDNGWVTNEEVLESLRNEIRRRRVEYVQPVTISVDHAA